MASESFHRNFTVLTLLLLTLIITTFFFFSPTRADDENLINKLCGATFAPAMCKLCVKGGQLLGRANPNDVTTEGDVLHKMLDCADYDITKLEGDIVKILDDSKTDDNTRKALQDCQPVIIAAIQNGGEVQVDVAKQNYDAAKSHINGDIIQKLDICASVLKSANITIPPPVFAGLVIVEGDYKMTYQILQFLKPGY